MAEDEKVGWHHWLDGHESEQAPRDGDGQGRLTCCSLCGPKESDTTEWLNWTELNFPSSKFPWHYYFIYSAPSGYRSPSSCLIFWNSLFINWLKCHTHHSAAAAAAAAKSLQSCPTLCDPIDGSPPGSPVPGMSPRTLEWVAISFSNAWKWNVKGKSLSHVRLLATPWTIAHQAPPSMGFSRQEYWSEVPLPSPLITLHVCQYTYACTPIPHPQFSIWIFLIWTLYPLPIFGLFASLSWY